MSDDAKRLLRIIAIIAAAAVLLVAIKVLVHVLDRRGPRDLVAARAEATAAGLPVDYSDPVFAKYATAATSGDNAATLYLQGFETISKLRAETASPTLPVDGMGELPDDARTPLAAEVLSEIREYVGARSEALQLIHKASAMSQCVFPIEWNGPDTDLVHLAHARAATRLLQLSMILAAEDADPHAAISAVSDCLTLAKRISQEPVLISGLVSCAVNSIALGGASRMLSRTEPTPEDLAALQKMLEDAAETFSIRAGLAGEIANMSYAMEMIAQGRTYGAFDEDSSVGSDQAGGRRRSLALSAWWYKNDMKGAEAEMIRTQMKLIEAAQTPTPEGLCGSYKSTLDAQVAVSSYRLAVMVRMLIPGQVRAIQQCELARAKLRAAAACVAAMRYRRDKGDWPATLNTLVPDYLAAVPVDPFVGGPLAYRAREDGIIAYTVGRNGVDNGGKYGVIKAEESDIGDYDDFGFRVWK